MGIIDEMKAGFGNDGGYDLNELKKAKENLPDKNTDVDTTGMQEVEPIDIEVVPHTSEEVFKTEELESRIVIVSYDQFDNVLRVEIL